MNKRNRDKKPETKQEPKLTKRNKTTAKSSPAKTETKKASPKKEVVKKPTPKKEVPKKETSKAGKVVGEVKKVTNKLESFKGIDFVKEFNSAKTVKAAEITLILSRKFTDEEMLVKLEKKFPGRKFRLALVRADLNAQRRKYRACSYEGSKLYPLIKEGKKLVDLIRDGRNVKKETKTKKPTPAKKETTIKKTAPVKKEAVTKKTKPAKKPTTKKPTTKKPPVTKSVVKK